MLLKSCIGDQSLAFELLQYFETSLFQSWEFNATEPGAEHIEAS